MRRPPDWTQFPKFPVTAGTILLAAGVSIAWWTKAVDISPIVSSPLVRRGELWRLVTDILPHANLLHLLFNVAWMWAFATLVEEVFGHAFTLAFVLVLALGSSAAEFAFLEGGVGLSGAVYGLFGMLWVLERKDPRFAGAVTHQTVVLFLAWFVICIVTTVLNIMPIANLAHGVGLLLGLCGGWALSRHATTRAATLGGVVVAVAALVLVAVFAQPYVNFSKDAELAVAAEGYKALQDNRNDEAVRWLSDATRMQPKDATSWYDLAIARDRLGRRAEAAAAYDRAYELNPSDDGFRRAHETLGKGATSPGGFWSALREAIK